MAYTEIRSFSMTSRLGVTLPDVTVIYHYQYMQIYVFLRRVFNRFNGVGGQVCELLIDRGSAVKLISSPEYRRNAS